MRRAGLQPRRCQFVKRRIRTLRIRPNPAKRGNHGGAAVTHERKRQSFDRRQAGRHGDVVHDLEREACQHAQDEERAEAVLGQSGRLERAKDDEQIEPERDDHAGKAVLFGQDREDEIVVRDRKEPQLTLRALLETLAPHPARSDGDAGLNLLVPGALGVLRRVQERGDAFLLIVLERELPRHRRDQHADEREDAEDPHRHAREKRGGEEHGHERHRRAEVGLPCDEHERHRGDGAGDQQVARVTAPPRRLSAKNLASTSASVALANSEGCRLSGPKSIQRRDPPRTTPRKST